MTNFPEINYKANLDEIQAPTKLKVKPKKPDHIHRGEKYPSFLHFCVLIQGPV